MPSQMVGVSASVSLPLHHKVRKFCSGTGSPGWSQKKGRKTVVVLPGLLVQKKVIFWRTPKPCVGVLPVHQWVTWSLYLVLELLKPVTPLDAT